MTRPLVSVVIPVYNQVAFVRETLLSAIEQKYERFEIIVADDGSTDGSWRVLMEMANEYPSRVKLLEQKPNQGIAGIVLNYNRALRACKGSYIAFLDGDDLFLPGKLERQVAWLEASDQRVLCGCDVEAFESKSGQRVYLWSELFGLKSGFGADAVLRHGVPFGLVAVMIRKSAMPTNGFDERLLISLDWKLWIDCLASGGEYGYVDGVYARYRRHAGNITLKHVQTRREDGFITLAKAEASYPALAGSVKYGRAQLFYGIGLEELAAESPRAARRWLIASLRQGVAGGWQRVPAFALCFLPGWLRQWVLRRRKVV